MIPSGYKQTEIGVIPEDWQCIQFGEYIDVFRGGSPRPIENYLTTSEKGINWIKIGDVSKNEKYITKTEERITPQGADKSRKVYVGDFILSNSMSFGRPYILLIDGCIHDGWLVIQNYSTTFDKEYLYYLLSSQDVFRQYISMAAGSSVQNLNKEKVSALFVTLPPLPEQKRIAEALSDMDKLISSLEKLIAKKKAIKQGAMQELLTGKRHLPGYMGKWADIVLGDNGNLSKESINPQNYASTMFWEYSMPAFDMSRTPVKTYGIDMHSNRISIKGPVLLFNKLNVRQKRIWLIKTCADNSVCSSEFLPYCSESIDLRLLAHILSTEKTTNDFIGMSTGTSNSQKRITPNNFLEYSVYLPKEVAEQSAIADVLDDMDSEIEQLEKNLSKYKKIKSGMMSELLTGRIRLV